MRRAVLPVFTSRHSRESGKPEGHASYQNQDLLDYRVFRIPPGARIFHRQALVYIPLGGISGYGEKRKPGEAQS